MQTLRCTICSQEKPVDEFNRNKARKSGRDNMCKPCRSCYMKARRPQNREYHRDYHARNKEKHNRQMRDWQLKNRYGMTREEYDAMLAEQNGVCAVCFKEPPLEKVGRSKVAVRAFHVDHCHTTGIVRGLLCRGCNVGVGHFEDDIERMKRMIAYLERSAA